MDGHMLWLHTGTWRRRRHVYPSLSPPRHSKNRLTSGRPCADKTRFLLVLAIMIGTIQSSLR